MPAPFASPILEDQLNRAMALLLIVEHVLNENADELRAGAEICLEQALIVLDGITSGLPKGVWATEISAKGKR